MQVQREGNTLILRGPFPAGVVDHLRGRTESMRFVRVPDAQIRMPATLHNAEAIDSCPLRIEWACEKPYAPRPVDGGAEGEEWFKTKPFEHQRNIFNASKDLPAFAFLMGMGTGKTKVGIDTAAYLRTTGRINRLLVLSPRGVHTQWVEEQLPTHCAVEYHAHVYSSDSWGVRRDAAFRKDLTADKFVVLSMNLDAVITERGKKVAEDFLKSGDALMIVDESHRIKTPGATRTKVVTQLGALAKFKRIMTGTPITRGTEDLWAQFRFLHPNIIGTSTFAAFVSEYCVKGGYEGREIVGYRQMDKLTSRIAPYSARVRKDQCLDLPPKTYMHHVIDLTKEQAALYKEVKEALKAYAKSNDFEVKTALEQLIRLRQIVGGFDPKGEPIPNNRPRAVLDIIAQTDGRGVIWATHTKELLALAAEVGKVRPVRLYYGAMNDAERSEAIAAYRSNPELWLIANPAAGGTGLNLDGAANVVYYTHSFNAEHRWQSEDRTHRATTRHNVTYHDLIAPGTVDVACRSSLNRKENVSEFSMGALRKFITELD